MSDSETREICKRGKVLTLFSTLSLLVNIVLSDLGKIFILAFIEHLWLVQTVQTVQTSTVSAIRKKMIAAIVQNTIHFLRRSGSIYSIDIQISTVESA